MRYLTAIATSIIFTIIQIIDTIQIQKSEPGPPTEIATATPTIFPLPIVPEIAVNRQLSNGISPRFDVLLALVLNVFLIQ